MFCQRPFNSLCDYERPDITEDIYLKWMRIASSDLVMNRRVS